MNKEQKKESIPPTGIMVLVKNLKGGILSCLERIIRRNDGIIMELRPDDWFLYIGETRMRVELETDRLILRKLKENDADAVFLWGSDPKVNRFMVYPLYKSVSDVRNWIGTLNPDDPDDYDMGFVLKDTGELIGSGGFIYRQERDVWVAGYNLRADQWGNGYVVEALLALADYIRTRRAFHAVEASIAVDNPNSIRVAEKLGLVYDRDTTFEKLDGSKTFQARVYRRVYDN